MGRWIEDVSHWQRERHHDDRGFLQEIFRQGQFPGGIQQVTHSMMFQGVIKAWHWHQYQTDAFYVPVGVLKVVLYDGRHGKSPTFGVIMEFIMSGNRPSVLVIPPGVFHGCKVFQGPCHLIYVTNQLYDPKDEFRVAHDNGEIGYDWLKGAPIT